MNKKIKPEIIEAWCQGGPNGYMPDISFSEDEMSDRANILREELLLLNDKYGLALPMMRLLVNTHSKAIKEWSCRGEVKQSFVSQLKKSKDGIEALLRLTEFRPDGVHNPGILFFSKDEIIFLRNLKNRLHRLGKGALESIERRISRLNPSGAKKFPLRRLLLPFETCAFEILTDKTSMSRTARIDSVANLFYGFGLEKKEPAMVVAELSKIITKKLPSKKSISKTKKN